MGITTCLDLYSTELYRLRQETAGCNAVLPEGAIALGLVGRPRYDDGEIALKLGNPLEIAPGLHQLRAFAARVTVLSAGEDALVIDAGGRGSAGPIVSGLKALRIQPEHVSVIAITHHHPDHAGGLARLAERTNARVAAHRLDAGIIGGSEHWPAPRKNGVVAGVTRSVMRALCGKPVAVDIPLEDGDVLPFADEVRIVHTPGHTLGSICFFIPSKGAVVVGDALQFRMSRLGPPAEGFTADVRRAHQSLARLLELDFDTICFSHYPPLTKNAHRELALLVERLSMRRLEWQV